MNKFWKKHQEFAKILLEDTWFLEKPVSESYVRTAWLYAVEIGVETVRPQYFNRIFGVNFKQLTEFWNKNVLSL